MASVATEVERFDDFYASTAPALVRQVHALTGDLAEAQDCVQEAYARAWQRWSTISEYGAPPRGSGRWLAGWQSHGSGA